MLVERGEFFDQKLYDAMAGILHQNDTGDASLDGAAIDFAHLRGGEDLHACIAFTLVL